jgi:soluble lytic murein transglycosylase
VSEAATALDSESAGAGSNGNLAELGRNAHYQKALELQQLGLDDLAGRELIRVSRQGIRGRRALLELSVHLSAVGDHHEALRVAKIYFPDYLDGARTPQSSMLWQVAYPTTYLPVIRSYTKNHVDPYLVAAIIREESLYDTDALSRAGAVGLMQIMPTTARTLIHSSQSLDTIRDELLDYDTNIRLGSQYLGNLLTQFSGNLMHAVAAYNAGPSAVSRWVARNGGAEPAEFVELIPYRETRGYVKRVLRSYREYHRLEETGCPDHSLDKGC